MNDFWIKDQTMDLCEFHFAECYESSDRGLKDMGDGVVFRDKLLSIKSLAPSESSCRVPSAMRTDRQDTVHGKFVT